MKKLFILFISILGIWACKGPKETVKAEKPEVQIGVDSVEYGVETFDSKFENWYTINNTPANYRSQQYYENWNRQYVSAWNEKATAGNADSFFEPIVGYNANEDYGFDVNHKLFYYFQYVENVLKIRIMYGGPKFFDD